MERPLRSGARIFIAALSNLDLSIEGFMHFLIRHLGGLFSPSLMNNPHLGFTSGFSPEFANSALSTLSDLPDSKLRIVLPNDAMIVGNCKDQALEFIEHQIKILYSEKEEWIFVHDNDLDIGIMFYSNDPLMFKFEFDIETSDKDFIIHLTSIVSDFSDYYNIELIFGWLKLRVT
jgi:hypothetical protein